MSGYGTNALQFLIEAVFDLYAMIIVLRFLMQSVRADYYNPVSQFVVKVTNPVLVPLRRLVPSVAGHDTASLVFAIAVLFVKLAILYAAGARGVGIAGSVVFLQNAGIMTLLALAGIELVALIINIFFFAIIVHVVLSWISQGGHNPIASLLFSLTQPILKPVQRFVPPIGGLDLSPVVAIIGLQLLKLLILPPLLALL
ncbi:MAG: YggT family protein [Gammaproteobacteria bacterium]|nr:YggT family protein [Gammaproteobacteria bacterium]